MIYIDTQNYSFYISINMTVIDYTSALMKRFLDLCSAIYNNDGHKRTRFPNNNLEEDDTFEQDIRKQYPKNCEDILFNTGILLNRANMHFDRKDNNRIFTEEVTIHDASERSIKIEVIKFYTEWDPEAKTNNVKKNIDGKKRLATIIRITNPKGAMTEYFNIENAPLK